MSVYFDSKDPRCKSPFGAVLCGTEVSFAVFFDPEDGILGGELQVREEFAGVTRTISLRRESSALRGTYTAPGTPELAWYSFTLHRQDGQAVTLPERQLTVYEDTVTPDWFGRGVSYQIFPDRFCRSRIPDPAGMVGDRRVHESWADTPDFLPDERGEVRCCDFFGGDLPGIIGKLDYLQELGVTTLYLTPIFESASNHRYNTADYRAIDPMLGTEEDFCALCSHAHRRGMRVVLDGVFNHTGSVSRYFNADGSYPDLGAAQSKESPYYNWYRFTRWPEEYDAWWGIKTLPAVEETQASYREFIIQGEDSVVRHWLRCGADGWRLDVADELPDSFIEKVRAAVKRVGPEKFLLGEVWEDATTKFGFNKRRTYLLGKGLDSVMNYPFKNAVLDFVKGKPAEQAMTEILTICEHYPAPAMDTALNFLSTHDTERALTVIADEPANGRGRAWQSGRCVTGDAYEEGLLRLRMAYAIIYTLPGVPCLYYGDEIAMQGYRDPFNRAFFRWDAHEQRLRPVLAQLAQLRHTCEAFRTGQLRVLRAEDGILHYQRVGKVETAEIIVNRTEHIIVETLASGKSTEVNPMGFTIVVEEVGHNPNHSYYDYV